MNNLLYIFINNLLEHTIQNKKFQLSYKKQTYHSLTLKTWQHNHWGFNLYTMF